MAFGKLVSNSVVGATKNGIKMNLTVTALKDKAIDTVAGQVEKEVPIELPFSTREVLNGGTLPSNFLSPEMINGASDLSPTLTELQKTKITETLDGVENTLNGVIQTVNVAKGTVNTITSPLNTLETVANTLNIVILALEGAITAVKVIPIPLGAPVGVGVPANITTGFADILVKVDKKIEKIKPPLEAVPDAIAIVNKILIPIIASLNSFDPIFQKIIQIITFIRLLLQQGPVSKADVDSTLSSITSNIQESLAVTAGPSESSSDADANQLANDELLASLESGLYEYRGFGFTLEFDSTNTFSFPARRIKAVKRPTDNTLSELLEFGFSKGFGVTLYSSPPDLGAGVVNTNSSYSFSTSLQVLVNETEFNIDQYYIQFPATTISLISGSNTIEEEENPPPPPPPPQTLEELAAAARQSLIDRGFTEAEAEWIQGQDSGLMVDDVIHFIDYLAQTPNKFFRDYLINTRGFSSSKADYLISLNYAFGWIVFIQSSTNSTAQDILNTAENLYNVPYTGP